MADNLYPAAGHELSLERQSLVPETSDAFAVFSKSVFKEGALDAKTKQLIAVAAAHVTQCPYCIRGHAKQALRVGATREEVMEAIWIAAEMRAGAAVAHSNLALDAMNEVKV
ncbi:MAG: carboxymuconolactone decarboxylase family protein [Candidatus Solibacter sp.]